MLVASNIEASAGYTAKLADLGECGLADKEADCCMQTSKSCNIDQQPHSMIKLHHTAVALWAIDLAL